MESQALKLSSPSAGEPIVYDWPLTKSDSYDAAGEIIDSILLVSEEHKELRCVMERVVGIRDTNTMSYEAMRNLCDKFSGAADTIRSLWKHSTRYDNPNPVTNSRASVRLLKHVVQQCYNRSVSDPQKLNHHYVSFTAETYGETSFAMMEKVVEELKPGKKDVFLDLGSGVGQVVLYMSGGTVCRRIVGIEKADLPATYAQAMQHEFSRWMKWYGKNFRPFELHKGNFLDEQYRDLILKEATIIFVNNYAFGPDLNNKLKSIFTELKDGTRIVSSIPFCNFNARMSDRLMTDLGAILDTVEITAPTSSVSWTCKNVPYFIHTVNRSKLEKYYFQARERQGALGREEKRVSSKSSSKSSSRESSRSRELASRKTSAFRHDAASPASDEPGPSRESAATAAANAALFGPTTRRQWNEWVSQTATPNCGPPPKPPKAEKPLKLREKTDSGPGEETSGSGSGDTEPRHPSIRRSLKKKRKLSQGSSGRGKPGRPRKTESTESRASLGPDAISPSLPVAKKSRAAETALQLLHEETLQSTTRPRTPLQGSLEVSELMRQPPPLMSTIPLPDDAASPPLSGPGELPAKIKLDLLMNKFRLELEAAIDHMQTPEFQQEVLGEIEQQRAKNARLLEEKSRLERQVSGLVESGVQLTKSRMGELGLGGSTPAELLEQAKDIVEHHQRLKSTKLNLEMDVRRLEQRVFQSGLDTGAVLTAALGTVRSPDIESLTTKANLIQQIGMEYRKQKNLISEHSLKRNDVLSLQAALPPSVIQLVDSLYPMPPLQVPPQSAIPTTTNNVSVPVVRPQATTTRGNKRGRATGTSTAHRKRQAPAATTAAVARKDPAGAPAGQSPEDIERQIQDIVQKALSVDSAAKSAEKERRLARNTEKKGRSKAATATTSTLPKTQAPTSSAFAHTTPMLPVTPAPTFSSPGLVPVFVKEAAARSGSASSAETESAPASDHEGGDARRHAPAPHRPASLPPAAAAAAAARLAGRPSSAAPAPAQQ